MSKLDGKVAIAGIGEVPTMIYVLLDFADRGKYDLSSLRNVIYGASAIAPERLKQAIRADFWKDRDRMIS